MLNGNFNNNNLTAQQHLTLPHLGNSPTQPTTTLNTYINTQHLTPQHHYTQPIENLYGDPRHFPLSTANLDKTYISTVGPSLTNMSTGTRFYATAGPSTNASSAGQANTILITNNVVNPDSTANTVSNQQAVASAGNIRFISAAPDVLQPATSQNLCITASGALAAPSSLSTQHVYNINNNNLSKDVPHVFSTHLLQPSFASATATKLTPHQFTTATADTTAFNSPQVGSNTAILTDPADVTTLSHGFYVAPEIQNSITQKIMAPVSVTKNSVIANTANRSSGPTVVLDRINICINNLYTDTTCSATDSLSSTPVQQPSPIIPAIQHKAVIQTAVTPPSLPNEDSFESNTLIIDEPDSTTTATIPHTPPITPENTPSLVGSAMCNSNNGNLITITSICSNNSPCTSSGEKNSEHTTPSNMTKTDAQFSNFPVMLEKVTEKLISQIEETKTVEANYAFSSMKTTLNPMLSQSLTPPSPNDVIKKSNAVTAKSNSKVVVGPTPDFPLGEDVLIKRKDGRFYLGAIMEYALPQYRIRFDDKTEVWCYPDEIRKLGGTALTASHTCLTVPKLNGQSSLPSQLPMCVACKLVIPEAKIEVCERCGRGYHQKCTKETEQGSGMWLCKRCGKSMKLLNNNFHGAVSLNLPYDEGSLTWDTKHCINEEQIYCYCGTSGTYEQNMLQCCRCLNWYHTQCTQSYSDKLLKGDRFFVFSCSVCNQGPEFFRRLQINWVDLIHLILYNLSATNFNQKYHHLIKDIIPYAIEIKAKLPIPQEWIYMPNERFKEQIRVTLNENTERFICEREANCDNIFYGLRYMLPPIIPEIIVNRNDVLNDEFLTEKLKLKIVKNVNKSAKALLELFKNKTQETQDNMEAMLNVSEEKHKTKPDVYEFRTEEEDAEDDNTINVDNDSSEDEIPIKNIMDKVKKSLEQMDAEDDNANAAVSVEREKLLENVTLQNTADGMASLSLKRKREEVDGPLLIEEKSSSETVTSNEDDNRLTQIKQNNLKDISPPIKSSRKRKAFSINKNTNVHRLIETSSDENSSSSSPGTSLDLIIPPPKNFLGQNNPFLMVTPKMKSELDHSNGGNKKLGNFKRDGVTMVKSSFFNTTSLSLSSKLAALKSAGIFPNLSTSNLAKAAGQPRTVRTIKRRLSAKDITIGPNQEVRRRRNRRLSSNVEVISTTTIGINPIPTNFFPIHAKDLSAASANTSSAISLFIKQQVKQPIPARRATTGITLHENTSNILNNNFPSSSLTAATINADTIHQNPRIEVKAQPNHGRRLRQRPQKISPQTSRRSSMSSNSSSCNTILVGPLAAAATSTSSSSTTRGTAGVVTTTPTCQFSEGLKQTVNKYFGAVNRIESGEQFSIRAKRLLPNGQMQYLIEWGEPSQEVATINKSRTQDDVKKGGNLSEIENKNKNDPTISDTQRILQPERNASACILATPTPSTPTPIIPPIVAQLT